MIKLGASLLFAATNLQQAVGFGSAPLEGAQECL